MRTAKMWLYTVRVGGGAGVGRGATLLVAAVDEVQAKAIGELWQFEQNGPPHADESHPVTVSRDEYNRPVVVLV